MQKQKHLQNIKNRLDFEALMEKQKSAIINLQGCEVQAKAKRIARILKDRQEIEPTMLKQFEKIDEFRKNLSEFKEATVELSKKAIIELEEAGKRDRIKWMQQ